MAAAALLSVTLVPVTMGLFIRGRIHPEHKNPIYRALVKVYRPLIEWVLRYRVPVVAAWFNPPLAPPINRRLRDADPLGHAYLRPIRVCQQSVQFVENVHAADHIRNRIIFYTHLRISLIDCLSKRG